MSMFPHLFSPIEVGGLQLPNRLVLNAHGTKLSGARYLRYLEERARGGVGLIGVFAGLGLYVYPTAHGRLVPYQPGDTDGVLPNPATSEGIAYYDQTVIPGLRQVSETIHRHGALCFGQLYHSGAVRHADNLMAAVAPSEIPDPYTRNVPHVLEDREIADIVLAYAHAARRIREAGMDAVELHAAHGYLINQFLSPLTNRRADRWGGSFENRARFLREIISTVRAQAGADFPIGVRLTAGDLGRDGGLSTDDVCAIAEAVADDVAYVSVSGGSYAGLTNPKALAYVAPWYVEPGPVVPVAAQLKRRINKPILVTGRIGDPSLAERIVAEGSADLVGMVRALIADPELPNKARSAEPRWIRPCIGNNECHVPGRHVLCAINPAAGREASLDLVPTDAPKHLLVIGGGPAGLELARISAQRGHSVTLVEKRPTLGGRLTDLARDPNRANLGDYIRFQQHEIEHLPIDLRVGTEVTPEVVERIAPDVVIVATGALPYRPAVPGIDAPHVHTAVEVLQRGVAPGQRTLVVGGLDDHLGPPTVAEFLADRGGHVILTCESLALGPGIEPSTLTMLTKRLVEKDVETLPRTALRSIQTDSVTVADTLTGRARTLTPIDSVVLACGSRADTRLASVLSRGPRPVYLVGDCRAPQRIVNAVLDAARLASVI